MVTNADLLGQITFFSSLNQQGLAALASHFREDRFEIGHILFYEGDRPARFWIVKDGQVKIVKYGPGGREIVIEVLSPGETFGGASMLMDEHPATAQALSALTTLSISVEQYQQILLDYPAIGIEVLKALGERMLGVIRMRMMMNVSVERRIIHMLLKLASKSGIPHPEGMMINLNLTRQDIADLADTTIETAIRTMSRLRKENLVKTLKGGYIVILDSEALAQIGQVHIPPE